MKYFYIIVTPKLSDHLSRQLKVTITKSVSTMKARLNYHYVYFVMIHTKICIKFNTCPPKRSTQILC